LLTLESSATMIGGEWVYASVDVPGGDEV